ncbi:hypothetical protein ACOME3_000027 [Neoechinorhynchus agilis]
MMPLVLRTDEVARILESFDDRILRSSNPFQLDFESVIDGIKNLKGVKKEDFISCARLIELASKIYSKRIDSLMTLVTKVAFVQGPVEEVRASSPPIKRPKTRISRKSTLIPLRGNHIKESKQRPAANYGRVMAKHRIICDSELRFMYGRFLSPDSERLQCTEGLLSPVKVQQIFGTIFASHGKYLRLKERRIKSRQKTSFPKDLTAYHKLNKRRRIVELKEDTINIHQESNFDDPMNVNDLTRRISEMYKNNRNSASFEMTKCGISTTFTCSMSDFYDSMSAHEGPPSVSVMLMAILLMIESMDEKVSLRQTDDLTDVIIEQEFL